VRTGTRTIATWTVPAGPIRRRWRGSRNSRSAAHAALTAIFAASSVRRSRSVGRSGAILWRSTPTTGGASTWAPAGVHHPGGLGMRDGGASGEGRPVGRPSFECCSPHRCGRPSIPRMSRASCARGVLGSRTAQPPPYVSVNILISDEVTVWREWQGSARSGTRVRRISWVRWAALHGVAPSRLSPSLLPR
jgi:hypothetical protein